MTTAETLSIADIPALLDELRREKFYGRLSFDLRAGEVALIRTERTQLANPSEIHTVRADVRSFEQERQERGNHAWF